MARTCSRRALALGLALLALGVLARDATSACCYFSALEKDVHQPGQRAFLTWDPVEQVESFTVQPQFQGNAADFGMVIPTPSQPRLGEVHRDFFKSLAVFTILRPMDVKKFKPMLRPGSTRGGVGGGGGTWRSAAKREKVTVLEMGVVGSLDYKILAATDAGALFAWLGDHGYSYAGDQQALEHYVKKGWFFTVMKIDPKQMKRRPDGTYIGEVTPTRFTFESKELVYPLRITRPVVKDRTDALFYVLAPEKMDLPDDLSYQFGFQSMWSTAYSFANWDRCSQAEKDWWAHVGELRTEIQRDVQAWKKRNPGGVMSTLEWSRRLTQQDVELLSGAREFDREAPPEDVKRLATLMGLLRPRMHLTKFRHVFRPDEMSRDLVLIPAAYRGRKDAVEHTEILPTSPP